MMPGEGDHSPILHDRGQRVHSQQYVYTARLIELGIEQRVMMLVADTTAILAPAVSLMMIPTEAVVAELQPLLCVDPLWH